MTDEKTSPDWIAVDWGTTRLRVWAMGDTGARAARSADRGMAGLSPEEFEPALFNLIEDWLPESEAIEIIACGMVGARTGWIEADYRAIPCPPLDPHRAIRPKVRDPRLSVRILPGLSQANPPDVMRGEETQIAGFLAENPGYEGALCLPGTHSKWVRIKDGAVTSFQTFMTGEQFALMSQQSVLRLSIGAVEPSAEAFDAAAEAVLADPHLAMRGLFGLRASALLEGATGSQIAGRLSGLLIGAEIAAAREFWESGPVTLIAAPALTALYARALGFAGCTPAVTDGGALVLAGLTSAYRQLQDAQ
ncbi:2-dehydro-3-deoxygalactonokinase [Paracoccus cavernae]|uniref:2-dehydro-3-deoxygalactonokinase n=1 Tax=Paracoccus cavernae TaxID=1571207 RepID=UPI0035F4EE21